MKSFLRRLTDQQCTTEQSTHTVNGLANPSKTSIQSSQAAPTEQVNQTLNKINTSTQNRQGPGLGFDNRVELGLKQTKSE